MNSDKYEDYFSFNLVAAEPCWKPVVWIEDVRIHKSMNIKEMFRMEKWSNTLPQAFFNLVTILTEN